MKKTFCKNNPNFVKDLSMIYVNFIITVIILSERGKKKRHYFYTAPHTYLQILPQWGQLTWNINFHSEICQICKR